MTDFNPDHLVDELIELEPSLAEFRADLIASIRAIASSKPDTKFSDQFKAKLLRELRMKFLSETSSSLSPIERMNKFFYALGGAAVASLVLYITVINPVIPMPSGGSRDSDAMKGPAVTEELRDEAFGNLAPEEPAMDARPQPFEALTGPQARNGSGGGGGRYMERGSGIAPAMGMPVTSESNMIAPGEPYPYMATEYIFNGDLKLDDAKTVSVMRRIQPKGSAKADLLGGTFVGDLVNVSKLGSLNVINVTLSESGPEPLNVSVDFVDGSVSINRQIDYMMRPGSDCQDEACFARFRLKESDMPSDDRVIAIAEDFLRNLGIDAHAYGEPTMAYSWREQLSMMPVKDDFYFPETVDVVFPYLVNGSPVFDEWGNPIGMMVNVDVPLRAALGVWGLRRMDLVSSEYAAVTDAEAFMQVVRRGGVSAYVPEEATTVQGQLGDPEQVYLVHYKYDPEIQQNYELYVPALAFPVTKQGQPYENRKAVVVPLAKELLEPTDGMVIPPPMPLEGDVKGMPVPGSSVDEMEVYPDTSAPSGVMQRPMEDGLEE